MNKALQFAVALGGAGLVVAAGSAYTASNTVPENMPAAYGSSTATGVSVESMSVTPAANPVNLGSVVYVVADSDVSGLVFELSTDDGATIIDASCDASYSDPDTTITCEPTGTVAIADITNFGLTATDTGVTP